MDITNKKVSRRTVAAGVAWAVPAVAVASAVPASAAGTSPGPVDPEFTGTFCKHPGEPKYYHSDMTWENLTNCHVEVTIGNMDVNGVSRPGFVSIDGKKVTQFTLDPKTTKCYYFDAGTYGDSANGSATLYYTYKVKCDGTVWSTGSGSVSTTIPNNLPPCKEPVKENPPHEGAPC